MVWLGPEIDFVAEGLRSVKRLAKCLMDNDLSAVNIGKFPRDEEELQMVRAVIGPIEFELKSPQGIRLLSIQAMLSHPWWRRVWTIQERAPFKMRSRSFADQTRYSGNSST